jgi:hypothetical protein
MVRGQRLIAKAVPEPIKSRDVGDVALQVLFPDAGGRGVHGESGADGRAALQKTWARVPPTAGSSQLSGCGEAEETLRRKTFRLRCRFPCNRKARSAVEGLYRLYTYC